MQEAVLEQTAKGLPRGLVTEVCNMSHLDRILDMAGPAVVTMCFYSRVSAMPGSAFNRCALYRAMQGPSLCF